MPRDRALGGQPLDARRAKETGDTRHPCQRLADVGRFVERPAVADDEDIVPYLAPGPAAVSITLAIALACPASKT